VAASPKNSEGEAMSNSDTILDLAAQVGKALQDKGLILATAESCTGGGVAQAITEIAGSTGWFDCGFITYSNASKTEMLDVSAALIAQMGSVSEEVAAAMASGALGASNAHMAVSTTGIAGPTARCRASRSARSASAGPMPTPSTPNGWCSAATAAPCASKP
jgi:PncC family amidohydrolase